MAILLACGSDAHGPGVDNDRVLTHVGALTQLGPRVADSDQARAAVAYIRAQLPTPPEELPVGAVALPEITVLGVTRRRAKPAFTNDPNLVVRFGPPGKALLIMAHYDSVAGSPGAVDNAAAVGVLLELAQTLAKQPPPRAVMLAFTAKEEGGLVGAEALAAQRGDEIEMAIALDLVGGTGDLIQNGASELIGLEEMRWLARAADRAGVIVRAPLAHRVVSRWWPSAERSDHGAFTRRGVRAFHLYHRGQDGDWIDLAYHSSRDVAARVSPESVDELARLLRALIDEPLRAHDGDGFWLPLARNAVVSRWILIAVCWLLVAVTCVQLLYRSSRGRSSTEGRASHTRLPQAPARRRLGLLVGIGCFALAVALAYALERAIAGDHPAPWLHAPRRWLIAELLVLGGVVGVATRVLARFVGAWTGERRYLATAVIALLVIGTAWLVIGAAELAWVWLLPAAALAIAPRLGRWGVLAILPALLPVALVLGPSQVREAAWNGFLPASPFVLWIAGLGFPIFAGLSWYLRSLGRSGPLGTFVLPVGCSLAILVGAACIGLTDAPCSAAQFHDFHLACEVVSEVR